MAQQHRKPTAQNAGKAGQIRIIGGQWRGRKLSVLALEGLRPTTDRVKETLFNWLQFELPNARVLDAFAGTGSLGLEALSRGASEVVFVEKSPAASKQLNENIATLQQGNMPPATDVRTGDIMHNLTQFAGAFDIVFLDPPFHQGLLNDCIEGLCKGNLVRKGSWVYIESEQSLTVNAPINWYLHREKNAGQVNYRLYHVA